jgi:predicted flap endonuclease-1-like 5' DNA nuclease
MNTDKERLFMTYRIDKIEGIGPVYRAKLEAVGIGTTDALLAQCGERDARRMIAAASGLREAQLLKWVNIADLMRLNGVGKEFSQLLDAAGVDTVRQLRMREPETLCAKLGEINTMKRLARRTPALQDVHQWVSEAKEMEPRVFH